MNKFRLLLDWAPVLTVLGFGVAGFGLLVLDYLPFTIPASTYAKFTVALLSAIASYLAYDRWITLRRLERVEAGIAPEEIVGLSRPSYDRMNRAMRCYIQLESRWKLGKPSAAGLAGAMDYFVSDHLVALEKLSTGVISVPEAQLAYAHGILCAKLGKRFDAVSERDLGFWLSAQSADYHAVTARAIKGGMKVNRIFILSLREINEHADQIVRVLAKQHAAGIGWGVALAEDLNLAGAVAHLSRDFGLFEGVRAATFFRKDNRRFEAYFNTAENSPMIELQRELFDELIGECWLVNSAFVEFATRFLGDEARLRAQQKAEFSNAEVRRLLGSPPDCVAPVAFLLQVKTDGEITTKVEALRGVVSGLAHPRGWPLPQPSVNDNRSV